MLAISNLALLLVAAGPLNEAVPYGAPPPPLQALVRSPGYQSNIARLFAALPPSVFQRCPGLVSHGSTVTVAEVPAFAADGYPVSGAWRQSFPVSGCGNNTTINFFFRGRPDEQIVSVVGAPGDTHADPTLQRDAYRFVDIAVRARIKDCTSIIVTDSRYGGRIADAAKAWREQWTVAACGHHAQVPLTFVPDPTGTTIGTGIVTILG